MVRGVPFVETADDDSGGAVGELGPDGERDRRGLRGGFWVVQIEDVEGGGVIGQGDSSCDVVAVAEFESDV